MLSGFAEQRGAPDANVIAELGHKFWLAGHRTPAELDEAADAYTKAHRACEIANQEKFSELERAETCRGWAAYVRGLSADLRASMKNCTMAETYVFARNMLEKKLMDGRNDDDTESDEEVLGGRSGDDEYNWIETFDIGDTESDEDVPESS